MKYPSPVLREILAKAMVDKDFREKLYTDQAGALADHNANYQPTADDAAILNAIPKEMLEHTGQLAIASAANWVFMYGRALTDRGGPGGRGPRRGPPPGP
jgi:hypothetical protein